MITNTMAKRVREFYDMGWTVSKDTMNRTILCNPKNDAFVVVSEEVIKLLPYLRD